MSCFKVIVEKDGENIEFPRMWADSKFQAMSDAMEAVRQFYNLHTNHILMATARVVRFENN